MDFPAGTIPVLWLFPKLLFAVIKIENNHLTSFINGCHFASVYNFMKRQQLNA